MADTFRRVGREAGRLDILVNVAWAGYERMVEDGRFTWPAPFWEQPAWRWEAMVTAGVRGAFVASQEAARRMVPAHLGLIVHISAWAAQKYIGNVVYGLSKAATDKMTRTWPTSFSRTGSPLCPSIQASSERRRWWPPGRST